MKTHALTVCIGLGLLLLGGCGEKVASELQMAVDQVTVEASKMASDKIESLSATAVEQLKRMQVQTGKQKPDDKSIKMPVNKLKNRKPQLISPFLKKIA